MKILFLAAEVAPFAKAGGLGDVAGALPGALRRLGHDVRVVMPRYSQIDPERWGLTPALDAYRFPAGQEVIRASLLQTERDGGPVYFVEIPWLFGDRPTMYDQPDEHRRFMLFTAGALAAMEHLGWKPDVVHAHDWHTALAPAMLQGGRAGSFYVDTAGVLTIHNLAYQGWAERAHLNGAAGLLPHWVHDAWVNLMALGIGTADLITTVSPTYAREILSPDYGEKLDGLLRGRQHRLHGVLNGLDIATFDPATDPHLPANYSADDLAGKAVCKARLQEEAGLPVDPSIPLLGIVGRLVDQKGFDLFAAAAEGLLRGRPLQVVVLGTGQPHYHHLLEGLQARFPDRLRAWITFDLGLAQRIYAGSDLFLMPSRFEPCGLSQMISMRYGTVPVVRATGGLADTVEEGFPDDPKTGFVFWEYQEHALRGAVDRALDAFAQPEVWSAIQQHGMRTDFSWDRSAATYEDLYQQAVNIRRG